VWQGLIPRRLAVAPARPTNRLPGAPAIEATQNRDKLKIADGYRAGVARATPMWWPGRGCYDGGTAASGEDVGKLKMEFLNPLTWDWIAFLKIAFGAGIGTAAVQGTLAQCRDARVKKDHAAYLALRVAVLLESYASESCDFIFENASAQHGPDEQYPEWNALLPTLPNYPDDPEGWRAMNRT
jgi:hypothetical protein